MSGPARPPLKIGAPFNPRGVCFNIEIPIGLASSTRYSSTAKIAYGHLVRRAPNGYCWMSAGDVAKAIGVKKRAAQRALEELRAGDINDVDNLPLIVPETRINSSGRQTSNGYRFIFARFLIRAVENDDLGKNDDASLSKTTMTGSSKTTTKDSTRKIQPGSDQTGLVEASGTAPELSQEAPSLVIERAAQKSGLLDVGADVARAALCAP